MILGWLYNKPVFPMSYSEKMNNVMSDIEYEGSFINLKDIKKLELKSVYEGMNENYVDIKKQIENSKLHFLELDKFLLL